MKKNLRIVSAAAAALLAVAPVAAAAVVSPATTSVAKADTDGQGTEPSPYLIWSGSDKAAAQKGYDVTALQAENKHTLSDALTSQLKLFAGKKSVSFAGGVHLSGKDKAIKEGIDNLKKTGHNTFEVLVGKAVMPGKSSVYYKDAENKQLTGGKAGNVHVYVAVNLTKANANYSESDTYQTLFTKAENTPLYKLTSANADNGNYAKTNTVVKEQGYQLQVGSRVYTAADGTRYLKVNNNNEYNGLYVKLDDVVVNPTEAAGSYFSTQHGLSLENPQGELANDATVYADLDNSQAKTIKGLKQAIMGTVQFVNGKTNAAYNLEGWNKYIFDNNDNKTVINYLKVNNATSDQNLISQLENAGIAVSGEGENATFNAGDKAYTITVRSNGGRRVNIVFQNTNALNEDAPAFSVRSDLARAEGKHQTYTDFTPLFNANKVVPTISLVQRDSGTFNPRNYIKAVNNAKSLGLINFDVKKNDVDWTKPGLYSVEVSAKNAAGKTTDITIPVMVSTENGKIMTVVKDANVYSFDGTKMNQANIINDYLHNASEVRVYDTKTVSGVEYYRIVSPTSNLWVRADALKNGVTTPANTQETTKTVKIMHIASIYDKNGKKTLLKMHFVLTTQYQL